MKRELLEHNDRAEPKDRGNTIETFLRQHKSPDVTEGEVKDVERVIQIISEKFEASLKSYNQEYDRDKLLDLVLATLDEAHGNFNEIFPENKVPWQKFIKGLEANPDYINIVRIEPLDYYQDVGNGMNPTITRASIEAVTEELKKRNPDLADDYLSGDSSRIVRAADAIIQSDLFYYFIDKEMIDQEVGASGHHHVITSMNKLDYIRKGYELPPVFIAKFRGVSEKFDGKQKVILDGTHRALVSAIVKRPQYVAEIDMDKIAQ